MSTTLLGLDAELQQRLQTIGVSATSRGPALARLSGMEGLSRSVLTGVVPVIALEALGTKAAVSYAYLVGAILTLATTLNLGTLERRLSRRWVLSLALTFVVAAACVYAVVHGSLLALGIGLTSTAASMFSVCIALFIMDAVDKRDLARNESRRMGYHGIAWLIGPSLGLWLWEKVDHRLPFAFSGVVAMAALAYFWHLRLGAAGMAPVGAQTTSPLRTVPRFFSQPRLRLAYAITTTRSIFWMAVFVYGPIYVIEAGLPAWVGGAMLSSVSALLLLAPFVNRVAERKGVRWVVTRGFIAIAIGLGTLAIIGDAHPIGLAAWGFAAVGGASLDVVGNIPFMRMVRPRERIPMTGVFSTWREVSSLLAPGIAAVCLAIGSFRLFYVVVALLATMTGIASTLLPKRL